MMSLLMSQKIPLPSEINKDVNQKVKDMIEKEFPGSTLEGESYIQLTLRNGSR